MLAAVGQQEDIAVERIGKIETGATARGEMQPFDDFHRFRPLCFALEEQFWPRAKILATGLPVQEIGI
jgi:hypothetical protein